MFVRWRRRPAYQSDFAQKLDSSGISCNALTLPWTKTDLRGSVFANKYIVWAKYYFLIFPIFFFIMQNEIFELGQKNESRKLPFPWMPFILHLKTKALHQLFHSLQNFIQYIFSYLYSTPVKTCKFCKYNREIYNSRLHLAWVPIIIFFASY